MNGGCLPGGPFHKGLPLRFVPAPTRLNNARCKGNEALLTLTNSQLFFWFLAFTFSLWVMQVCVTGRIVMRGRVYADRAINPKQFWFYLTGFLVAEGALVYQAIYLPY